LVGQVGNAWTDADIDNYGALFYWWSHALISDATFKGISNEVIPFLPNCSIVCTFSMPPVTSDMDYVVMEISAALCTVVMEKVWAGNNFPKFGHCHGYPYAGAILTLSSGMCSVISQLWDHCELQLMTSAQNMWMMHLSSW